jgi:hypothetical protein
VNVVVYDLTAVLTPVDNFTGRSYVRFGIEERIGLSFTASPAITATNTGGLQWKIASGGGRLEAVTTDGTATFFAPEIPGAVTLKLEVQAGPSKGNGLSKNITIVAPSGGYEAKAFGTYIKHNQNTWSVGFLGEIYVLPKDVSFLNLRFVEEDIPAVATGWLYAPLNGVSHYPDPIPRAIGSGNINTGSLVSREDGVWTGILRPNPTYGIGDVYWDIPWKYVTSSGNRGLIGIARQHATSDQVGTATIEKVGAGPYSRVPSDPTSDWQ